MPTTPVGPLQHVFHPAHAAGHRAAIESGLDLLGDVLGRVRGPATGVPPEVAAKRVVDVDLDRPLGDTAAALEEMRRLWLDDTVWFHETSYAAHLNCPVVIPAVLAELFIASVNTSMDTYDQSIGATFMERHLVAWTAGRIGFGTDADGIFTSGGSQSNLQALLLARGRAEAAGVPPARMRILTSEDSHFSVQKSARLLGLGDAAVVRVAVDEARRMDLAALDASLTSLAGADLVPVAVVATAGTTDFGAIDPLPAIADRCAAGPGHGIWLHVDAAYGGGLLASTRRRHLLGGIERADSVTVDFHKTFFQPVSSSALVVREASALAPVTWHADYLNPIDCTNPNQVDKSLQTTRRFDALKLWLTLRIMGADQVGGYVDAVIDLAREVHDALVDHDDIELAAEPHLSTVVFRYRPPVTMGEAELTALTNAIRAGLFARGTAMVAATTVEGRRFLKLTLLNPMATRADILAIVDEVRALGHDLLATEGAA